MNVYEHLHRKVNNRFYITASLSAYRGRGWRGTVGIAVGASSKLTHDRDQRRQSNGR